MTMTRAMSLLTKRLVGSSLARRSMYVVSVHQWSLKQTSLSFNSKVMSHSYHAQVHVSGCCGRDSLSRKRIRQFVVPISADKHH